jgi:hypothetical protein
MYIWLILLVIVLLLILYMRKPTDTRGRIKILLEESSGVFDEPAKEALAMIDNLAERRAEDHFSHARILHHNILEGEPRRNTGLARQAAISYANTVINMTGEENTNYMLGRIEDYQLGMQELQDNDIAMAILNDAMVTRGPTLRHKNAKIRREKALESANTRTDAIVNYLEESKTYTVDPQNVHDSVVNGDLRYTLGRIKSNVNTNVSLEEIRAYIDKNYPESKAAKAHKVIDKMAQGGSVYAYGETEDNVLAYTWNRCKDERNKNNSKDMFNAVVDSLVDSVENNNIVCANGRCARVLGSLVTLDYDPTVGKTATLEAYRNQIFQETKDLITTELTAAKQSTDDSLKQIAMAYDGEIEYENTQAESTLKSLIQTAIDNNIESYKDTIAPGELQKIKEDCYVYATI